MNKRPIPLFAAVAMVAALLLGACSSGGDDDPVSSGTTTTVAPSGDDTPDTTTDTGDDGGETDEPQGEGDTPVVTGDGKAYVDAMANSMKGDPEFPITDQQADCIANRTVDTIGADRLAAAGISPEQFGSDDADDAIALDLSDVGLTEADGNRIYDHYSDCGLNLRETMMQGFATDDELTPMMRSCFEGVFTDDNLRTLMVTSMIKGEAALENDPALAPIMGAMIGCAFMGMGEMDSSDFEGSFDFEE